MRWLGRGLQGLVAVWVGYVGLVGAAPLLGLRVPGSDRLYEAQLTAFPLLMLGALVGMLALMGLVAVVARARRRRAELATAVVAALAALGALAWSGLLPVAQAHPTVVAGTRRIAVASWNTEANLTADGLLNLLGRDHPEVLVLPETEQWTLDAALDDPRLATVKGGYQAFVSPHSDVVAPVAVLVSNALGRYHVTARDTTTYGSLTLEPDAPGEPVIVGLHAASPIPERMEDWRADLGRISALAGCTQTAPRPVIVAGDFNATLTHGSLAVRPHCVDAQSAVGATWDRTWPTSKPEWMGTTIDHVFLGGGVSPVSCQVATIEDSDHRAVLATVALPA